MQAKRNERRKRKGQGVILEYVIIMLAVCSFTAQFAFTKIFENKDSVENAKACIQYFVSNDSIPDSILERVSAQYPNFMEIVKELLETEYTFEELINTYKAEYKTKKIYSSATVLYCSNAFSDVFDG